MNVFELFGTIAINNKDANNSLRDTADKAERTGARIQAAFKNIGSVTMKIGKTIVGGAMAIGTAWAATVESTRDYRTAMAKLDTAFTTNGHSSEMALKTYQALQAVLGETDQAVEAANHLAKMCSGQEDLAKWTDICTGVYATFGDSLPIEGLTESANETSKVGQVTGSLADALNWAGISEEDFNLKLKACRTEEERQDLIMNTLIHTYGEAATKYKETGKSVMEANTAQDKLNRAMAKLGEIGEPIMTGLKTWVANMVNTAAPHLENLITKLSNFDQTMQNDVWPWLQEKASMSLGIVLPDWETFKGNVTTWWDTTKTNLAAVTQWALQLPDKPHESAEQLAAAVSTWWTGTALPAISSASTWALNLFDHPVEDGATIEAHVKAWWGLYADTVAGACNWTLRLFGMPEETADTITSTVAAWWNSVSGTVVDACSFTARFLGIGEWTNEQDEMLDAWWAAAFEKLDAVCQWVINPQLPNEEETQAFVDSLTAWWTGVQQTTRDVFNINPEKEDKYIAYDAALEKASGKSAVSKELTRSFTSNSDSFIDFGAIFSALFSNPASVPVEVSNDSEGNMQSQIDGMRLEGTVMLYPDTSRLNMINGMMFGGGGVSTPMSKAVGLDEVPYDGFYAHLHKGEAILNKTQADVWRGGSSSKIESLLAQLVANTSGGQQIVLDTGAMVGQLAPAMDARLGTISSRKGRGN